MARFGLSQELPESVQVIEPLGYLDMVVAEKNARLIATDSGGVQKEAFFFQIPCITLREASEWEELIEHRFNRLAAADPASIVRCARQALESAPNWNIDLYGDGHAAEQIVSELQLLCEQASIAC